MALFERHTRGRDEDVIGMAESGTGALSVTVVENDFVERVYEKGEKLTRDVGGTCGTAEFTDAVVREIESGT